MIEVTDRPQLPELLQLVASVMPDVDSQSLEGSTDLYALGLDSGAAVELMLAVESRFNMTFPDSLIDETTFRTPQALLEAVRRVIG